MGHPEVAPDVLLGVGALLLADDHDPPPPIRAKPVTIALAVAEQPVAVELDELVGHRTGRGRGSAGGAGCGRAGRAQVSGLRIRSAGGRTGGVGGHRRRGRDRGSGQPRRLLGAAVACRRLSRRRPVRHPRRTRVGSPSRRRCRTRAAAPRRLTAARPVTSGSPRPGTARVVRARARPARRSGCRSRRSDRSEEPVPRGSTGRRSGRKFGSADDLVVLGD